MNCSRESLFPGGKTPRRASPRLKRAFFPGRVRGRRLFVVGAAVAFLLYCLACPVASRAAKREKPAVIIKFATLAPEGSTWMKTMHAIDAEVRKETSNRIGFKFYSGGVQGDEKDVLRKIRNGQLHGGGFTGYGLGSIAPKVRVLELPFLFESAGEIDFVRARLDSIFRATFEGRGMLLLGWADVGFIHIFSNRPISSPEDLKRAKMWIWSGDPLAELFFDAFGVSPIPLSVPDVLTSLQMGVIDAVYASPLACVAVQWFTRVKYMTDVPITYSIGAVLVSKKALRKVSREDIDKLLAISERELRKLTEKTRLQNIEAMDAIEREGIEVIRVEDNVRRSFFKLGKNAWSKGEGRIYPPELLARILDMKKEYHSHSGIRAPR
jgi:TRAP-type C4-dicarboxylate transport system substrate-binding protein